MVTRVASHAETGNRSKHLDTEIVYTGRDRTPEITDPHYALLLRYSHIFLFDVFY
jgi:hypothetical protein